MSAPSTPNDSLLSNIKKSTNAIIQGFHAGTPEALLPGTSESFTYHVHPATAGISPMTRAEFVQFWQSFMVPNLTNFDAEIHIENYDVTNRRSTIYLSSTADTPLGKKTWKNEAIFMSQFGEDGKTLLRMDEMLDSAFLNDFMAKLEALKHKNGGNGAQV